MKSKHYLKIMDNKNNQSEIKENKSETSKN